MMHRGRIVDGWRIRLGLGMKLYDEKLAGIARALTETIRTSLSFMYMSIFTNKEAVIWNSYTISRHTGHEISLQIQQLTKHLLDSD